MIPPAFWQPTHSAYDQAESESNQAEVEDKEREQKMQNQTPLHVPAYVNMGYGETAYRERERKRDFNTPLGGGYLATWMIVFLFVIGILVFLSLFHPLW